MPRAIVMQINEAINRALKSPAFIDRFGKIGDEPAGGPPEAFAETIRIELAKWADVVKRSGAKL
jgi:tripartite-type tricarboxylate transporter receptor subunit TctC